MKASLFSRLLPLALFATATIGAISFKPTVTRAETGSSQTKISPPSGNAQPHARSLDLNEQGVIAVQKKQYEIAEQLFKRSISLDPANLTAVHNLAGMYLQNQKPDQAITLLNQYQKDRPNDPEFIQQLGDAWFVKRNSKAAREAYQTVLTVAPTFPGVAKKLASVCLLEKDFECTEIMLERAAKEQPNDAQVFANLSSLYLARGKADKSVAAAKRALQLSPTGDIYAALGAAYEAEKDYSRAKKAFERASELGFEKAEMAQRIAALNKEDEE